ncbi:MAG TPA: LytTR family DNA-binding domain-containing protein [Gemmatimonadaceae bacterium]|jgi:two-component system LytT family response regulator|nr:LytTR family DNA-binding domain-containing protein [Gemmatimonadaceae bacterium]
MIRALIADDEELSRRALRQLLARHADVQIVAECRDGEEARAAMASLRPDVALLDVRMPLGTGLDVARDRTAADRTVVVFVTAYDQFALPAFDVEAADYLTKPLSEPRFDAMLDRVRRLLSVRQQADQAAAGARAAPLVARVGSTDVLIPLDTVDYIEADDVYAAVVARGKRQLVRTSLDALEEMLDPREFVRTHRSYIVRIDRVAAVRRRGPGVELALTTGAVLPVSRRRRPAVARLLDRR